MLFYIKLLITIIAGKTIPHIENFTSNIIDNFNKKYINKYTTWCFFISV